MLELLYVSIDDEGFITKITSMETENSIGMHLDPNSDLVLGFRKYRYDAETNELIYDESNVIDECKSGAKSLVDIYSFRNSKEFEVEFGAEKYRFKYSNELRNELTSFQSFLNLGITQPLKLKCIDKDGIEQLIEINAINLVKIINEMVSFINNERDSCSRLKQQIDNCTTLKEIQDITKTLQVD